MWAAKNVGNCSVALESQKRGDCTGCARCAELDDETSAEIDGQLLVLSALADGESSALGRQRGAIETSRVGTSCTRAASVHGRTCTKSFERDPVTTASEVT